MQYRYQSMKRLFLAVACFFVTAVSAQSPAPALNGFTKVWPALKTSYQDDRSLDELRQSVLKNEPVRENEYTVAYADYRRRAVLSLMKHGSQGLAVLDSLLTTQTDTGIRTAILGELRSSQDEEAQSLWQRYKVENPYCPQQFLPLEGGELSQVYSSYALKWSKGDLDGMAEHLSPEIRKRFLEESAKLVKESNSQSWLENLLAAFAPGSYLVKAECVSEDRSKGVMIIIDKGADRLVRSRQIEFLRSGSTWKIAAPDLLNFFNSSRSSK